MAEHSNNDARASFIELKIGVETTRFAVKALFQKSHCDPVLFLLTRDFKLYLTDTSHDIAIRRNGLSWDDMIGGGFVMSSNGKFRFVYHERYLYKDKVLLLAFKEALEEKIREFAGAER